jgi:hypothetical protein
MGNYGKNGDLVAVTSGGDTADRAAIIMNEEGRLTWRSARLNRWRAGALASLRLLIQVSILKDRQHNSSRFHEDLPAFVRDARRAIRAPGVVLVATRSTRGSAKT